MRILLFLLFSMCHIVVHAEKITTNLGDIIEINGYKAIVFYIDESGKHGKAMYVKAFRGVDEPWCCNGKHARNLPYLANTEDGKENTTAVLKYADDHNSIKFFPVFNWCKNLGKDWYIPSLKELESFINFWLGNEEILNWDEDSETVVNTEKTFFKEINKKLSDADGIPFINGVYTSTVDADGKVYVFNYDRRKNTWSLKRKSITNLGQDNVGRAFITF